MLCAQGRVDNMEGLLTPFNTLFDEGQQDLILFVQAVKKGTDMTMLLEFGSREVYRFISCVHNNLLSTGADRFCFVIGNQNLDRTTLSTDHPLSLTFAAAICSRFFGSWPLPKTEEIRGGNRAETL